MQIRCCDLSVSYSHKHKIIQLVFPATFLSFFLKHIHECTICRLSMQTKLSFLHDFHSAHINMFWSEAPHHTSLIIMLSGGAAIQRAYCLKLIIFCRAHCAGTNTFSCKGEYTSDTCLKIVLSWTTAM